LGGTEFIVVDVSGENVHAFDDGYLIALDKRFLSYVGCTSSDERFDKEESVIYHIDRLRIEVTV
jgi:hypothetical protein